MSAQTPVPSKRITAPEIAARKGGEPIVSLTSYHAHTARHRRPVRRLPAGRRQPRHGHARLRVDRAGAARADDHARPRRGARRQARAGRGRHAVRLLRGEPRRRLPQRRAGDEGDRLRRHQARGRHAHGRDHPLPHRARHPGDGPHRPHAAVDQRAGRLQDAGPRARRVGGHRGRRQGGRRGRRLLGGARRHGGAAGRAGSPPPSRSPPSASARPPAATARSW